MRLNWRLPDKGMAIDSGANDTAYAKAIERAFGPLPYRTVPHDVHLLRAMAATEPKGGFYERLAELVEHHRVIEIFDSTGSKS